MTKLNGLGKKLSNNSVSFFKTLTRFSKYCFSYKSLSRRILVSAIISSLLEASIPFILLYFIDGSIISSIKEIDNGRTIVTALSNNYFFRFLALFVIITLVIIYCQRILLLNMGKLCNFVIRDLRKSMFVKLQSQSFSYFDKTSTGWHIANLTSDSFKLPDLIWGSLLILCALINIIASIIIMFIHSVPLSLIVILTIPIFIITTIYLKKFVIHHSREFRRSNSELFANFTENLNSIEFIKASACENETFKKFQNKNEETKLFSINVFKYALLSPSSVIIVSALASFLVIFFGAKMTYSIAASITVGTFVSFFAYSRNMFAPIIEILNNLNVVFNSAVAAERVFSLLDEPTSKYSNKTKVIDFLNVKGQIEIKNVSFNYNKSKRIINKLNLQIKDKESIAIVGPTGEGKSTIVNLISGFYRPQNGTILIDDIDYMCRSHESLLRQIGYISQTPIIFNGTVRENIIMDNPEITDDEIIESLFKIGAPEIIDKLNQKLSFFGNNLSFGEKQFIAFARALVRNPKILIMDEATSAMDVVTETKLRNSIRTIIQGRTSIIIAHRLSTIKYCDRILYIKKGAVIEDGSHDSLMKLKGEYFNLFNSQKTKEVQLQ